MPLKFQKGSILIWLVVIFLIFGLLGGGSYYYLEIYAPAQYAKAVVNIYDEIRTQQVEMNFKGGGDYEGALAALDQYQQSFTRWSDQLSKINPSPLNYLPPLLNNTRRSQQISD